LVDLNRAAVGTQYGQTVVAGSVTLDAATLVLNLGTSLVPGATFTIIENDGTDAVDGIFAGLPEGKIFVADGHAFSISYRGGSGNDVTLTAVVPEPGTWLLLLVASPWLCTSLRGKSPRRRI
jgi:hypothetical protein